MQYSCSFFTLSDGLKTISLSIQSDDPDRPELLIPIQGTGSLDGDGVSAAIEDAAPNDGDNNNDEILDSLQNNVASVDVGNGSYISYITQTLLGIDSVEMLNDNEIVPPPDNLIFSSGVAQYVIDATSFLPGSNVSVGIILPSGRVPKAYYIYGATADNSNPHWYEFSYDAETGTGLEVLGNVSIISDSGKTVSRSVAKLHFVDGLTGDTDLVLDGKINVQGAIVVTEDSSGGSGQSNGPFLIIMTMLMFFIRSSKKQRSRLVI